MTRKFTFLGTATSSGVPVLGCDCPTCTSSDPRDRRQRSAALITLAAGRILIDTPPEIRYQLLQVHATDSLRELPIRAVLYTHHHADHIFGFDDIRGLCRIIKDALPVYCREDTAQFIRHTFAYAFDERLAAWPPGLVPRVSIHCFTDGEPFTILGQTIVPIALEHNMPVTGFRLGELAYLTDVGSIPDESWQYLEGVRILILSCLRPEKPHPGHITLQEALAIIERIKPQRAYLTHLGHEMKHARISQQLPAGVMLAFDGLSFEF
ncbi:Phosphoribosyl 1,2-cyclic phosphate phosphodiesterase [bacterium HR36]|nr:Phosphoribosyl 1,2-cyclic phosphate phosphodiesterase [bacterium HR36]